jgi:hypothetical protein
MIALISYTTNHFPIGGSFSTTWFRIRESQLLAFVFSQVGFFGALYNGSSGAFLAGVLHDRTAA